MSTHSKHGEFNTTLDKQLITKNQTFTIYNAISVSDLVLKNI